MQGSYAVAARAHGNARCHPDRSAAAWRGLPAHQDERFLAEFTLERSEGLGMTWLRLHVWSSSSPEGGLGQAAAGL